MLRAKQELKTAEDQLRDMVLQAERWVKPLQDWGLIQPDGIAAYHGTKESFELGSWPDARTVNDALKACHEAEQKVRRTAAALTSADRRLVEPLLPSDF
jgi:hypothetical protein